MSAVPLSSTRLGFLPIVLCSVRAFISRKSLLRWCEWSPFDCCWLGMKMYQIRTDITNIIFVFIFLVEFGFEYT